MVTPFFESPLKIAIKTSSCLQHADTALVRSDWTLTAPDGAVAMAGSSAEILRHGTDGLWRFIIDDATFASRPLKA
jgi:ketosteroid isomerase-like protein